MKEKVVIPGSPKAWLLAMRPKTLSGAAVPVMIALALSYATTGAAQFKTLPAALCVLFALIMQIDANFVNDYFDFMRGNDDDTRLGPRRACAQGWISPRAMLRAIVLTTLVACAVGLPLVMYAGMWTLGVGALCVLFCFLYTTSLSYLGLGAAEAIVASLSCGLVIDTLLLVNNYRDIDNDAAAGKKTLVVRLGHRFGRMAYLVSGLSAVALGSAFVYYGHVWAAVLPLVYAVLHVAAYRSMVRINKGKALNMVLGTTARNMFFYGILVSVGFLLG